MCREVSKDLRVKPEAHDLLESTEMPTELPTADSRTDGQRRRNLLQEYEQQFEQLSDNQKLSKLCSDAGLKTVERGNILSHFMHKDRAEWHIYADNTRCFETIRELERQAGFVRIRKWSESWTHMFVIMKIVKEMKFRSDLCFKTEPLPVFEL